MDPQFSRTQILLGDEAMEKLQNARVAVFGIGGVGGYTAEALARSGIGTLDLSRRLSTKPRVRERSSVPSTPKTWLIFPPAVKLELRTSPVYTVFFHVF